MSNCVPCDGVFVFIFYKQCIITQPVRATPNQDFPSIMSKKDKMVGGTPKRLCVSHSSFNGADFRGEGTVHFRSFGEQTWQSIWNEHKIIAWSHWPYNDYLNIVFDTVVEKCLLYFRWRNSLWKYCWLLVLQSGCLLCPVRQLSLYFVMSGRLCHISGKITNIRQVR